MCKNAIERFFDKESILIIKKIEYFNNKISKYKIASSLKKIVDNNAHVDEINNTISQTNMKIIDNSILLYSNKDGEGTFITTKDANYLYEYFLKLYSEEIYSYSPTSVLTNAIEGKRNEFNMFNIVKQIYLFSELISYLKTNERKSINLEYLGLSKNAGILLINKKLKKGATLIFESNCGFYNKRITI